MTAPDLQSASPTSSPLRRLAAAATDVAIGLALIGLGFAGLVLPMLPGWLLIAAGAIVLAGRVPPLRSGIGWVVARPRVQAAIRRIAAHRGGRLSLVRLLKLPPLRRALIPRTRHELVHNLTQSAAGSAHPEHGADGAS